ncbi:MULTISPECIES: hypothetical protein [unclassified Micromonospora]|uniref:hypothetical protein n=2 Tax=Micromonosporaceae TaxID=28056 RepID=UPI0003EEA5D0|nr:MULTISPECIES: hypothetical protein [unclassified Micromonospora]EWM66789.1 hypothetical protein MCBG_03922 [Micromonospora sp. M42]
MRRLDLVGQRAAVPAGLDDRVGVDVGSGAEVAPLGHRGGRLLGCGVVQLRGEHQALLTRPQPHSRPTSHDDHGMWRMARARPLWEPVAMSRARLALTAGVLLLVASCMLPCLPFLDLSGISMPYQDPTPEMLEKQAIDIAAAERKLALYAATAGALAVVGLAAVIYAFRHRRSRRADHGI